VPSDPARLTEFIRRELTAIQQAAHRPESFIAMESAKAAPEKSATGLFFGTGAPTFAAGQGSLYLRADGSSTSTRAYINTDGGTTWTAVTTAA